MKLCLLITALVCALGSYGQESEGRFDFPLVITLHFPALATPFRNLDLNFRNIGVGVGTEVTLNTEGTWVQQFHLAWMRNAATGNSVLAYSQLAWRAGGKSDTFAEVKVGIGYAYAFTAAPAKIPADGQWISRGHQGKGMLAIPIGVAVGHHFNHESTRISPFVGYQFMVLAPYNKTIPIVPQTIVQTGLGISR